MEEQYDFEIFISKCGVTGALNYSFSCFPGHGDCTVEDYDEVIKLCQKTICWAAQLRAKERRRLQLINKEINKMVNDGSTKS